VPDVSPTPFIWSATCPPVGWSTQPPLPSARSGVGQYAHPLCQLAEETRVLPMTMCHPAIGSPQNATAWIFQSPPLGPWALRT
jgi:hypothetical protein